MEQDIHGGHQGITTRDFDELVTTAGSGGNNSVELAGYHREHGLNNRLAFFFSDAAATDNHLTNIRSFFNSLSTDQQNALLDEIIARGHAGKDLNDLDNYLFPPRIRYDRTQSTSNGLNFIDVPSYRLFPAQSINNALLNAGNLFDAKFTRMTRNLGTRQLTEYVDQNSSDFAIYDYARINSDYTLAMDALQFLSSVVDAVMASFSVMAKGATYISGEDMSSSEIRYVKN